jgi:hypothetical protein
MEHGNPVGSYCRTFEYLNFKRHSFGRPDASKPSINPTFSHNVNSVVYIMYLYTCIYTRTNNNMWWTGFGAKGRPVQLLVVLWTEMSRRSDLSGQKIHCMTWNCKLRTSRSSALHIWFTSKSSWVHILAWGPAIRTEELVPQIKARPLPSCIFSIH